MDVKPPHANMDDDVLLYLRVLFASEDIKAALRGRYTNLLSSLKSRVLDGRINGMTYHMTMKMMRADAIREGLTAAEFDSICTDIEYAIDYTQPRIHYAYID
jgi:hypothetical protein